jgi:PAS domain S-box-containing protein
MSQSKPSPLDASGRAALFLLCQHFEEPVWLLEPPAKELARSPSAQQSPPWELPQWQEALALAQVKGRLEASLPVTEGSSLVKYRIEWLSLGCWVVKLLPQSFESEIARNHHLLQAVIDTQGNATFIKDKYGRYLLVSRHFAQLMGLEPEVVVGSTDYELLPHKRAVFYANQDALVLRSRRPMAFEDETEGAGGHRYYRVLKSPYFDSSGQLQGVVGQSQDITELRTQAQELRRRVDILRESQKLAHLADWSLELPELVLRLSPDSRQQLGLTPEQEARWAVFQGIVPAEDRPKLLRALRKCMLTGEAFELIHRVRLPDGTRRTVQTRAKPEIDTLDGRPRVVRIVGISMDVTDLAERERETRETLNRLDAIFQHAPIGIAAAFANGTIFDSNRAFKQLLPEALLSSAQMSEFTLLDRYPHLKPDEEVIAIDPGRGYILEVYYPDRRNGDVWLQYYVQRIKDPASFLPYLIIMVRDVTETRRTNRELIQAKERAEAASQAKSQFLALLSHDIRNPLNGIAGCLNLLERLDLTAQQQQYTSLIRLSYRKLAAIIQNILDYSRMEADRYTLAEEPFDLRAVLEESIRVHEYLAREKQQSFHADLAPDGPWPQVLGDAPALGRIVDNLLGNAVKFTPEYGRIGLEAKLQRIGDDRLLLRLVVADSGRGIAPEHLAMIFEPFFQVDTSTTKDAQGTGLGLSIVKHYIERLHGKLQVESSLNEGSTFTVTLELALAPDAPFELDTEDYRQLVALRAGRRVLVAEDDEINAQYLHELLSGLGLRVSVAYNGQQALQQLRKKAYDLLITDGAMPKLDGFTLIRTLRGGEDLPSQLPVLAITGYAQPADQNAFLEAGANDYLTKPIDEKQLLRKIHDLLPGPTGK